MAVASSLTAWPPANAVVIRDESGKLVTLPPAEPSPDLPRKTAEEMASDCGARPLLDPSGPTYSNREIAAAALSLLMIAAEARSSGKPVDPAYGTAESEINAMISAANELERCRYNNDAIDRASRAMDSCAALQEAVEKTDAAAASLARRDALTPSEWVKMLELFLPAAQACRNKLGRCFNPNRKSQSAAALALERLKVGLNLSSRQQASLQLHLPVCTKTNLRAGLDKPRGAPVEIEYLNTMIGDEFVSVGGELR